MVASYEPLTASLTLVNDMPVDGKIILVFPKWDDYSLGANFVSPMITSSTVTECNVPYASPSFSISSSSDSDTLTIVGPFD